MLKPRISKSYAWTCPDCDILIISVNKPSKCHECGINFEGRIISCRDVTLIDGGGSAHLGHEFPRSVNSNASHCHHCGGKLVDGSCNNTHCKGSRCYDCDYPTPNNCYHCNHPVPFSGSLEELRRAIRDLKENSDSKPTDVPPFVDMTRTTERYTNSNHSRYLSIESEVKKNSDRLRELENKIRKISRICGG